MGTSSRTGRRPFPAVHAIASIALCFGIAACTPTDAGLAASSQSPAGFAGPAGSGGKATPVAMPDAIAAETAASPVDMPPAEDIEITPMEWAKDPEPNARISVRFGGEETLPDTFGIEVDQRSAVFKRSEQDPRRFEGDVHFDFDAFVAEQKARAADLAQYKEPVAPRFNGRDMVGEERLDMLDPGIVSLARANGSTFRIPRGTVSVRAGDIDPARVLTITDLGVVEDPQRTFDVCNAQGNPEGAWTFKALMTQMANTPRTGVTPEAFVEQWMKTWDTSPLVNSHIVPARTGMTRRILDRMRDGNGRIDWKRSPFRLLAIVNRLDLRSNPVYGGGNGGELRFVFGVANPGEAGGCSTLPFTVIFEYGVPVRGCSAVKDYAGEWLALGASSPGTTDYNRALQTLTDRVTTADAVPLKPNGSAINRIRTNEIALSSPWELRQFEIPVGGNLLKLVSTSQTPSSEPPPGVDYNASATLARFMDQHRAQILGDRHVVPASYSPRLLEVYSFLAGATHTRDVTDGRVWMAPSGWPVDPEVRHKFSLATCNGCHGGEARDNIAGDRTSFVHVDVRMPGHASVLSKFLTGEGGLSTPSTFLKPDPAGMGSPHRLGDLLRRRQDIADFASGSCEASGLVQNFYGGQLRFTH